MANVFGPKDIRSTLLYQFDFSQVLGIGEEINNCVITVSYTMGPTVPSEDDLTAMVVGTPGNLAGLISQLIGGGFPGNTYEVLATVTTNLNQVIALGGSLYTDYL